MLYTSTRTAEDVPSSVNVLCMGLATTRTVASSVLSTVEMSATPSSTMVKGCHHVFPLLSIFAFSPSLTWSVAGLAMLSNACELTSQSALASQITSLSAAQLPKALAPNWVTLLGTVINHSTARKGFVLNGLHALLNGHLLEGPAALECAAPDGLRADFEGGQRVAPLE